MPGNFDLPVRGLDFILLSILIALFGGGLDFFIKHVFDFVTETEPTEPNRIF